MRKIQAPRGANRLTGCTLHHHLVITNEVVGLVGYTRKSGNASHQKVKLYRWIDRGCLVPLRFDGFNDVLKWSVDVVNPQKSVFEVGSVGREVFFWQKIQEYRKILKVHENAPEMELLFNETPQRHEFVSDDERQRRQNLQSSENFSASFNRSGINVFVLYLVLPTYICRFCRMDLLSDMKIFAFYPRHTIFVVILNPYLHQQWYSSGQTVALTPSLQQSLLPCLLPLLQLSLNLK